MQRIELTKYEMRELFRSFILSEQERKSSTFDEAQFDTMMQANIETVDRLLTEAGFTVGFQDADDLFVNYDYRHQRIVHTKLTNNAKRASIEETLYRACFELREGMCVVMNIKNHERRSCERSLVSRNGIYVSDWTADVP